jgi:hypothetical protein
MEIGEFLRDAVGKILSDEGKFRVPTIHVISGEARVVTQVLSS